MLETQIKALIKSLDLSNELLMKIINDNAYGGNDAKQPGTEVPKVDSSKQPASPEESHPEPGSTPKSPPVSSTDTSRTVPNNPVENTAPVNQGPHIPQTPAEAESIEDNAPANDLQTRVMAVSQATSNPMLGMQFLAQFKVASFSDLTPEQIAQTDKQLAEIAAAAGVAQ